MCCFHVIDLTECFRSKADKYWDYLISKLAYPSSWMSIWIQGNQGKYFTHKVPRNNWWRRNSSNNFSQQSHPPNRFENTMASFNEKLIPNEFYFRNKNRCNYLTIFKIFWILLIIISIRLILQYFYRFYWLILWLSLTARVFSKILNSWFSWVNLFHISNISSIVAILLKEIFMD